jgi:hypothetical protein
MVGGGTKITSIGENIPVTDIQLIAPESFIDYKGTRAIIIPKKDTIFQYSEEPSYDLERSFYLMKTTDQAGESISKERMQQEVDEGKMTQDDMDAILTKMKVV